MNVKVIAARDEEGKRRIYQIRSGMDRNKIARLVVPKPVTCFSWSHASVSVSWCTCTMGGRHAAVAGYSAEEDVQSYPMGDGRERRWRSENRSSGMVQTKNLDDPLLHRRYRGSAEPGAALLTV